MALLPGLPANVPPPAGIVLAPAEPSDCSPPSLSIRPTRSKVLAVCLIALACIANVVLVARTCAGVLRLKVFIPEHVRLAGSLLGFVCPVGRSDWFAALKVSSPNDVCLADPSGLLLGGVGWMLLHWVPLVWQRHHTDAMPRTAGECRQELKPPCLHAAASLLQKWGPMSHLPLAQEGMRHTLAALTDTVRRFGC